MGEMSMHISGHLQIFAFFEALHNAIKVECFQGFIFIPCITDTGIACRAMHFRFFLKVKTLLNNAFKAWCYDYKMSNSVLESIYLEFHLSKKKKNWWISIQHDFHTNKPGGGGGGVLRWCLDGGARLKPPNPYPSLRVILAEKGTHY